MLFTGRTGLRRWLWTRLEQCRTRLVTLSVHDPDLAVTCNASLMVPLSALIPDEVMDSTMVFHAAEVGAFADLAAVVARSAGAGERVLSGGYVTPLRSGNSLAVSGLAAFSVRNQAMGVLIDQGCTPDEARIELCRRSTSDEAAMDDTAQDILDHLAVTTTRARAAGGRTLGTGLPAQRARTRAAPGAELTA